MMVAAPEYYIFTGRVGEVIPLHVTHVLIAKDLKFVPAQAFRNHPNIVEVICHDGVEKIEQWAFRNCLTLLRVIMPGVKEVEKEAFYFCEALTCIECGKLEIIGESGFGYCKSLSSIDLPSIRIVERYAFDDCRHLTNVNFGKDLESIGRWAFAGCRSLERIALPLKDGIISHDNTFQRCSKLNNVDLVGGVHETIAAFLMEEWKDDAKDKIDSISQILPNTPVGYRGAGGKAKAIRRWIRSVLRKYTHYEAEHRRCVNEAAAILQSALPNDIVLKSVLPFVDLPTGTFEGEDEGREEWQEDEY